MGELAATYEFRLDQGVVLVRIPRGLLVFTKAQWVDAIRRGKLWRRHGGERLTQPKAEGPR